MLIAAHMPPLMPSGGKGPLEWVTVASSTPAIEAIVVYQLRMEEMAWNASSLNNQLEATKSGLNESVHGHCHLLCGVHEARPGLPDHLRRQQRRRDETKSATASFPEGILA